MGNKDEKKGLTWKQLGEISWEDLKNNHPKEFEKRLVKLNNEMDEIKEKVENNYINIIQVISILVAVLALVLGNILGFKSLPENINGQKLTGFLFIINGIVLIGISFLIFLIKYVFLNDKWKKEYKWFLIFPIGFQIIGLIVYLFA